MRQGHRAPAGISNRDSLLPPDTYQLPISGVPVSTARTLLPCGDSDSRGVLSRGCTSIILYARVLLPNYSRTPNRTFAVRLAILGSFRSILCCVLCCDLHQWTCPTRMYAEYTRLSSSADIHARNSCRALNAAVGRRVDRSCWWCLVWRLLQRRAHLQ